MASASTTQRAALCPRCGYDLRGATGPRCSECGSFVGKGMTSRIPWVKRRWDGAWTGYCRTLWLVLWRPSLFADETKARISRADARRFFWISMLLAMLVGTALFGLAFLIRKWEWEAWALPLFDDDDERIFLQWDLPRFALWDSPFVLLPVGLTILCSQLAAQACYRWFLRVGAGSARLKRRLGRIGLYYSGLAVWESFLLGLQLVMVELRVERRPWLHDWHGALGAVQILTAVVAVAVFLAPTLNLIIRTGRNSWLRGGLMVVAFPLVRLATLYLAAWVVFWICGYLLIAGASMAGR